VVSFVYDSGNRLTQAGTTAYTYDANDNRIVSAVGNSKAQYAYENTAAKLSQLLVRTNPDGSQTFYVYGLGLIGQQDSTGYSVYHFDFRGSTAALTNSSGAVTDRFTYRAYGELLTHTGNSDTPFLYNGRDGVLTDANGLYYTRARYYSPELKRFLNADSRKGSIDKIQTLNLYNFVVGNPISLIDPAGMSAELTLRTGSRLNYALNNHPNIVFITPHTLPKTGEPNSVGRQYDDDGNLVRERYYGPDGRSVKDKDYKHGGQHEFPHEHDWDWSKNPPRQPAKSPSQSVINKIIAAGVVVIAGVAMIIIASDDITGVGVADDVAEVPLGAAFMSALSALV